MDAFFKFLESQPFILLFLTVAAGLAMARLKWKGVTLGVVASTLIFSLVFSLVAHRVSGVEFHLPDFAKTIFFNLFIYAVGLRVGPQCFAGLQRDGKRFVALAIVVLVLAPALAIACAMFFGFSAGSLTGMMAGSNTGSASFGAAQAAVAMVGGGAQNIEAIGRELAVSFALAYALSMSLFVVVIGYLPLLTGHDLRKAAKEMDDEIRKAGAPLPQTAGAIQSAKAPVDIRAYRVARSSKVVGKSLGQLSQTYPRAVIQVVRRRGQLLALRESLVLEQDDEIAVGSQISSLLLAPGEVGPEIDSAELRGIRVETADVVLSRKDIRPATVEQLQQGIAHGLYFNSLFRLGEEIPLGPGAIAIRGDVIRATGASVDLNRFAQAAGGVVKVSVQTDLLTLAIGLVLGTLLGSISVKLGSISLSLGSAAGLLIVSILISWQRTRRPLLGGPFPEPARKFIEDFGLAVFIAILGLKTGPGVVAALQGGVVLPVLISTLIVGFLPMLVAWYVGVHAFKMNPALLLGAICGARQDAAGLSVAQEKAGSAAPAIGFAVPYTISTLTFTIYGYLAMVLWKG